MLIPFGTNDWSSPFTDVNRLRLHNMYLVDNPLSPDGISRIPRPGLSTFAKVGFGQIYGMWQQEGSFNGDIFVVAGNRLYRMTESAPVLIGVLIGEEHPQFAGNTERILILRDGVVYSTNGSTLSVVPMPDNVQVGSIACIDSVFLLSVANTQVFYWLNPGETTPDPLNFASAERIPDKIVSIAIAFDEIWFLGSQGPEVWTSTGDADAPYRRITGRVYSEGCQDRKSVVVTAYNSAPAIMWVTDKRCVVLAQGQPQRVSNDAIEEFLRSSDDFHAWGFRQNRHDFYVLTCDQGTFVYDITKGNWSWWDSLNYPYWRARTGIQANQEVYAGDSESNTVWTLEETGMDDTDPIICEVSGFVLNTANQQPCYSVNIACNTGWTGTYTTEPIIELRWSDDLGSTWSPYMSRPLGKTGKYTTDVTFRSLGDIFRPGREFEIRFAAKERIRVDYATMNEV